jgi:hypothetical protein
LILNRLAGLGVWVAYRGTSTVSDATSASNGRPDSVHRRRRHGEHPQITGLNAFERFLGAKMEIVIQARKNDLAEGVPN